MFSNIGEKSMKTPRLYRLGVLITFDEISDLLKTHSNISRCSEEWSVEISETYFVSD